MIREANSLSGFAILPYVDVSDRRRSSLFASQSTVQDQDLVSTGAVRTDAVLWARRKRLRPLVENGSLPFRHERLTTVCEYLPRCVSISAATPPRQNSPLRDFCVLFLQAIQCVMCSVPCMCSMIRTSKLFAQYAVQTYIFAHARKPVQSYQVKYVGPVRGSSDRPRLL